MKNKDEEKKQSEILRAEAGEAHYAPNEASASDDTYEFELGDNFTPNKVIIDFSQISTKVWNPEVSDNN